MPTSAKIGLDTTNFGPKSTTSGPSSAKIGPLRRSKRRSRPRSSRRSSKSRRGSRGRRRVLPGPRLTWGQPLPPASATTPKAATSSARAWHQGAVVAAATGYHPSEAPPGGARSRGPSRLAGTGRWLTSTPRPWARACRVILSRAIAHRAKVTDHIARAEVDFTLQLRAFWNRPNLARF